ncbi:inositol hexakisphosphate kinase 1 [Ciona intestinalis]
MMQSSAHDEIDVKKILNWRRFSRDWEKPFALQPFGHQVGGRASILCYNPSTICKPYVSRELYFYHNMPTYLKEFTPDFRGTVNVTFIEEVDNSPATIYAHPKSHIKPRSHAMKPLIEDPKPHSKRCVKDYGKTHVIFPTNLVISALRENSSDIISDDMDMLTYGFGANVSIRSHTSGNKNEMEGESMGLQNPWNTKVMVDALTKLRSKNTEDKKKFHTKTKRFILLENVTSPYKRPCVLDLKIGTRVRQDASAAKLARHATAIDFGARLSGMQIYSPLRNEFAYLNKYYGHNLTVEGFKRKFVDFFSRGAVSSFRDDSITAEDQQLLYPSSSYHSLVDRRLVRCTISKLERLREAISKIGNHRFYSCSVLLIYEGQLETEDESQTKCAKIIASGDSNSATASADTFERRERPKSVHLHSVFDAEVQQHDTDLDSRITSANSFQKSGGQRQKKHSPKRYRRTNSCSSLSKCFPGSNSGTSSSPADCPPSVDVRLIDFAHYCFHDEVVHPGPDGGFLFGIDNVIALLGDMLTS